MRDIDDSSALPHRPRRPEPRKGFRAKAKKSGRVANPLPCPARHSAQESIARESSMILVTGATGLNGSAVVREFSRNGVAVRALVRDRSKAGQLGELPHVELVEGDMARAATLDRALERIDRVL